MLMSWMSNSLYIPSFHSSVFLGSRLFVSMKLNRLFFMYCTASVPEKLYGFIFVCVLFIFYTFLLFWVRVVGVEASGGGDRSLDLQYSMLRSLAQLLAK